MSKRTNAIIKLGADVKDAKTGIDVIIQELNKLRKTSFAQKASQLGSAVSGVASALSLLIKGVTLARKALQESTEAYNSNAESAKKLELAARNNPYLNSEGVAALKDFSNELQKVSTYAGGDLQSLMSQLASAGRTQKQIMEIMGAAVDVAASGTMSLESAVSALNKTYSGTAGTLGNQISGLKNLTKEQLASGEAVRIVAEKYKGMAQEVANATGSSKQLKNATDDLKAELGAPFEKAMSPMRQFFTDLIQGWTDALAKKREYNESKADVEAGKGDAEDYAKLLANAEEEYDKAVKKATRTHRWFTETWQHFKTAEEAIEFYQKEGEKGAGTLYYEAKAVADASARVEEYKAKLNSLSEEEKKRAEQRKQELRQEEIAAAKKAQLDRRNELRASYTAAIEAEEARIQAEEKAGKKISESEKAQRLYNVALSKYIEMMSDPAFDRSQTKSGMWEGEQEMLNQIAGYATASFDTEAAKKNFASFFPDKKTAEEEVTEYYSAQMEALQKLYDSLPEEYQKDFADDFAQAGERLATAQKEAMEKVHADERAELYSHLERSLEIVQNFIDRYTDVCSGIADIIAQNAEAAATSQTLAIEKQYAAGKLSAEQYEKSLKEIEHKKAQESYRAQMWQWTANLAQATASTAQAVIQTLADATLPTAARIAMSAIIGAAGAAQLATVIGSKPIPPSFSTGGIVGGSSYYGDRISANVNSGEMILTRAQQRLLFDTINRGSLNGSMTNNVTIKNYASPDVSATVRQDGKALEVYIQKTVASQMEKGAYNRSLAIASMGMSGEKYTS